MESPSALACRELLSRHGILLAVLLFIFWSQPTTAQLAIVPVDAAVGEDVMLHIYNNPPNASSYIWYRGQGESARCYILFYSMAINDNEEGPNYTGRESMNREGWLLIKNVTMKDAGMYTVVVFHRNFTKEIGFGHLNVYEPVRVPTLLASITTATHNKDTVVMTCYTNAMFIEWLFNGESLELKDRMKLSWNNRILTIKPVMMEDAGFYECEVYNRISSAESEAIELHVNN